MTRDLSTSENNIFKMISLSGVYYASNKFKYDPFGAGDRKFNFSFGNVLYANKMSLNMYLDLKEKNYLDEYSKNYSAFFGNDVDKSRTLKYIESLQVDDLYNDNLIRFSKDQVKNNKLRTYFTDVTSTPHIDTPYSKPDLYIINSVYSRSRINIFVDNRKISMFNLPKMLNIGSPMLWYSVPHLKKSLENIGFQFPTWINYEYDSFDNSVERKNRLIEEISRLNQLDVELHCKKYTYNITRHNSELYSKIVEKKTNK